MLLTVTYYNYDTDLDRKIYKIVKQVEKSKTFSGVDGGRSITYSFNTLKALNVAKKALKARLQEDCNLKFKVIE